MSKTLLPEWAPQDAVMLAWPHETTDWAPWLKEIEATYVELTTAIAKAAVPLILCRSAGHESHIKAQLDPQLSDRCAFVQLSYDDTWCRDYGPLTVGDPEAACLLDFQFSGWGDKYEASQDNEVNRHLSKTGRMKLPLRSIDIELEGGSVEADGTGTLLTTEACLLGGNRNEHMDREQLETALRELLGVSRVIWIKNGFLQGDDTDSHVDNLVRFASCDTLVHATCDRTDDVHHQPLAAMADELRSLRQQNGEPYRLVELPIPEPKADESGRRLPASYVNFIIVNGYIIMPVFDSPCDAIAIERLKQAFPEHEIITVTGTALIKQNGGPHCATMQLPRGTVHLGV
jgi:agmatine deiminase